MKKIPKRTKKKDQYKQLKIYDRDRIEALLNSGHKQTEIAKILQRDKGTISREIERGSKRLPNGEMVYIAKYAQFKARNRERNAKRQWSKINQNMELKEYVEEQLLDWQSPDAISGRMKDLKLPFYASKTCIYKWFETPVGDSFQKQLYSGRKRMLGRRKNKKKSSKREMIPDRISIHDRPDIDGIYGHWEVDTIVSGKKTGSKEVLVVGVERLSMRVVIQKIPNLKPKTFEGVMKKITRDFTIKSFTRDNGIENKNHKDSNTPSFFCDPYSSWQKGKVEEVNKMIRWFIPKGSDISLYSNSYVKMVENILNNKYRKSLGYLSPYEVMLKQVALSKKIQLC